MQKKILEHFMTLSKIPHCSGDTEQLKAFLITFAKSFGYMVEVDDLDNILIYKGDSRLVLQAHYDMVCIGEAPSIKPYSQSGWLRAERSSLGADNGIAIAMMMLLMERGESLAFLLTSDEEIGLVGASGITLKLNADYILNLDYEDEAIVCIGCAGGADLVAKHSFAKATPYAYGYEVRVSGLPGGHSGVEIHKNIPNAIKVMATYLQDKEVLIASATGGERRNSIPTEIVVQLTSKAPLPESQWVEVKAIDTPLEVYQTEALLSLLRTFENGVITYNEEFDLPDSSINLAILEFEAGRVTIECSSRAMSDEVLERINNHYLKLFEKYGFDGKIEYKYPAWRPEINPFSSMVNDAMHEVFGASRYEAIHAGLECGMLLEKYPTIKFASIGPTILSPHSTSERVKLDSVENTFRVVEKIIAKVQN